MSPVGLSIGYFSPAVEIGDVAAFCDRIREICPPTSEAYPLARTALKAADGTVPLFMCVCCGSVPVHIEPPNAAESCSTMFTFVLEAEERPVLLFAPAGQREAGCIYKPEESQVPTMGFGAVELWPGRAIHFDVARAFHAITSFPTGDTPARPSSVFLQVPWPDNRDVGGAVWAMKSAILADERFNDLTRPEVTQ
jgi:hypothetical protein